MVTVSGEYQLWAVIAMAAAETLLVMVIGLGLFFVGYRLGRASTRPAAEDPGRRQAFDPGSGEDTLTEWDLAMLPQPSSGKHGRGTGDFIPPEYRDNIVSSL